MQARVAQSVEHWSNKPTVAGSIPVVSSGNFFFCTPVQYSKIRRCHIQTRVIFVYRFEPRIISSLNPMQ